MRQSLPGLIKALCDNLQTEVLPDLGSDHARVQLAGVLDTLAKLAPMISWSPDSLHEQLASMQVGINDILERARQTGYSPPECVMPDPSNIENQQALEHAVRHGEQVCADLTDWLFDSIHSLPATLHHELDARLRQTMRDALASERRLIAKADFTAMTHVQPTHRSSP
jgi:hypothetical protein